MRNAALLAFGFVLLLLQTSLAALVSLHPWWPTLLMPIVIYLGVAPDADLVRGAAISFVLGYLADSFCGSPMGLETFVFVATFMLARAVRLRLVLRGPLFQVLMTFAITALSGVMILALRAIFERNEPFALIDVGPAAVAVLAPACSTALVSPFVFLAAQRIDSMFGRRRDEEALL